MALAIAGIGMTTSCTRTASRATTTHFMSATVTGHPAFNATGSRLTTSATIGDNSKLEAYENDSTLIEFGFISFPSTPGTYTIDRGTNIWVTYNDGLGGHHPKTSVHGSITLTALRPDLTGTFSCTLNDSSVITGSFNMTGL